MSRFINNLKRRVSKEQKEDRPARIGKPQDSAGCRTGPGRRLCPADSDRAAAEHR